MCNKYKDSRTNSALSAAEKKEAKKQQDEHLQQVVKERLALHQRIRSATSPHPPGSPDPRPPFMKIYLDGMDQEKTDIPHMEKDEIQKHGKPMKCRCSCLIRSSL